jgi:hypothetical protein
MATIKDYSPEDQQKIKDYIKSSGGMADFGTATLVLKVKPTSGGRSSSGSSSGGSSGGLNYQPSSALDTNNKGWYVTSEGKRLNPKFFDEYGNRISGGSSGGGGSSNSSSDNKKLVKNTIYGVKNGTPNLFAGGSSKFNESTGRYEGGIPSNSSPSVTSEANTISKSYDDQKNALIQRIRETVLQGTNAQKNIISQAPQQFQPLRNQVDINSSRGLQNLKETLANQGNITAGLGRQEIIQSGADRQNDINDIDLEQQNIISQANQQIAQLQSEGRASEAQAISDNAMAKLQAIIDSNRRAEDVTYRNQQFGYQKSRDKIEDAFRQGQIDENARKYELDRIDQQEQIDYNRGQSEKETQYDRKQQEMQDFRDTIGQYSGDYQAEINDIVNDGDTSNDWKLPFLKAARAQKIQAQLEQGQKTADAEWANAYKAWLQLTSGATAEMARILGIPKGTKAKDVLKTNYDIGKPYTGGGSSGGSSGGGEVPWYLQ